MIPQIAMRPRGWWVLLAAAAVILALIVPGAGAEGQADRVARSAALESVRLLVQLQSPPLADLKPGRDDQIRQEQETFRAGLRQAGVEYRELSSYNTLFNGVAIKVKAGAIGRISGMKGVMRVFIAKETRLPTPQLHSSVRMIGAPRAWAGDPALSISGIDGSGVTVGIIDTGIDYTHPDLGGCLGPNCRVIGGYDFVGKNFA